MTPEEALDNAITHVMESFELAMQAENLSPDMIARIMSTVGDAIANNADKLEDA